MNKTTHVILLDWDGPISNPRVYRMPNEVDPVAVQAINDLTAAGCLCVLTSTIRKHFDNAEAASLFLSKSGMRVNWLSDPFYGEPLWRTDKDYTNRRETEFITWYECHAEALATLGDLRFLALDDEVYTHTIRTRYNVQQPHASTYDGLGYEAISQIYKYIEQMAKPQT